MENSLIVAICLGTALATYGALAAIESRNDQITAKTDLSLVSMEGDCSCIFEGEDNLDSVVTSR
jgi:hypothetical protein